MQINVFGRCKHPLTAEGEGRGVGGGGGGRGAPVLCGLTSLDDVNTL